MAVDLVTTDEAMAQLRLDDDASEAWLEIWIPAVSEAVSSWLKDEWRLYLPERDSDGKIVVDSDGVPVPSDTVDPTVKCAVLLELASQMRFREGDGDNRVAPQDGYGFTLSRGATAILSSLRKPTIA